MESLSMRGLMEKIVLLEAKRRCASRNLTGLVPMEGREEEFRKIELELHNCRELMRAAEAGKIAADPENQEKVARMPAGWQREIMESAEGQTRMVF